MLLTTFRRNGNAVATPVWVVPLDPETVGGATRRPAVIGRSIRRTAPVIGRPGPMPLAARSTSFTLQSRSVPDYRTLEDGPGGPPVASQASFSRVSEATNSLERQLFTHVRRSVAAGAASWVFISVVTPHTSRRRPSTKVGSTPRFTTHRSRVSVGVDTFSMSARAIRVRAASARWLPPSPPEAERPWIRSATDEAPCPGGSRETSSTVVSSSCSRRMCAVTRSLAERPASRS